MNYNLWHWFRCVITGNGGSSYSYLGRPWGPFGRVVFAYTYMDQCIKHVGWHNWGKAENERSACFYEYRYLMFSLPYSHVAFMRDTIFFGTNRFKWNCCRCFGPGCCQSKRVTWSRELLEEEAEEFLMHGFIDPDQNRPWLAQRMALKIPYSA